MDKYISIEGKKIHYTIEGSSDKKVLLVHGFPESIKNWMGFEKKFAKNYQTIAIDLPGFGKSDLLTEVHTMPLFADVIRQIVIVENFTKYLFIGHSMGGYIGLEYAKKYKEDLTGLVLLNSHALADSEEKKQGRLKQVEILKAGKKELLMKEIIPDMFAENNLNKYKEYIDKFIKIATSTNTQGIIAALLGMRLRENNLDFVHNIAIPLLVLSGNKDKLIPLEITNMHINKNNPNIRIEILENVGHASFIEAPDKTFEIIEKTMLK